MDQGRLLMISQGIKPGRHEIITYDDMREAAAGSFSALDRMGGYPRKGDVIDFSKKIAQNWQVDIRYDHMDNVFVMSSQRVDKVKFCENPACRHHVDVDWDVFDHRRMYVDEAHPGGLGLLHSRMVSLHEFRTNKGKIIFLCDDCRSAVEYFLGASK